MQSNSLNTQQIVHPLTDPNLLNHILSFCDHQTQQSSIPFVSKLWLETAKGINKANFQNNAIPNPRLLSHIFSYVDPLTQQKILPKVAKSWETTVRCTCQSTEDNMKFKQACRDLIDHDVRDFRQSKMYGFPSWWGRQDMMNNYKMSRASSLHGKIQSHHAFVPYTKEQAKEYVSGKSKWDTIIIRPADDGRSDRCVLCYFDSRAQEYVQYDIKLGYANNCFTLIKHEEIDNQLVEVEVESFKKVKHLVDFIQDKINEGKGYKPGEIVWSEGTDTVWGNRAEEIVYSEKSEDVYSNESEELVYREPKDGSLEGTEEESLESSQHDDNANNQTKVNPQMENMQTEVQRISDNEKENVKNLENYIYTKLAQFRKK